MSTSVTIPCGIMRHAIYRNEQAMRLLLHVMLMIAEEEAAHTGAEPREAGVLVRSMHELGLTLRWHRSKVVRALEALRKADAVKTRAVAGGTEIRCLYYSPAAVAEKREPVRKKKAAPAPQRTPEERVERFIADCRAVIEADPSRLPEPLRKEFVAYWTEPNDKGAMRFELQPFFDHGRRMDTWRRNAEAKGFRNHTPETGKSGPWNPRS